MPTPEERDLGRLVYRGIQAEDAVFKSASDDIAQIVQSLGDGKMTDIDRSRAMRDIDRVLDRSFGSTQSAAQRSDLTQTIYESMQRAADVPFQRAADQVQDVLRNDQLYRGLYGPIVTQQRARRAAMLDVNRRWVDPNGYRLSDRVWKQGRQVRKAIDDTLREGIKGGMSADRLARELRQYLDPSNAPTRYTRGGKIIQRRDGGTKRGYASSRARTLARTEITRVHGLATIEAAKVTPGVLGVRWRLSANHSEQDECNDLATADRYNLGPGVYPPDAVPTYPRHPNDLCSLLPEMKSRDDVLDDILREYGEAPQWRPTMTAADAARWAEGSSIPMTTTHVTRPFAADRINKGGFDVGKSEWGRLYGDGVYMGPDTGAARFYERLYKSRDIDAERINLRVNTTKTMKVDVLGTETKVEELQKVISQFPGGQRAYESKVQAIRARNARIAEQVDAEEAAATAAKPKRNPFAPKNMMEVAEDSFDPSKRLQELGHIDNPNARAINEIAEDSGYDSIWINREVPNMREDGLGGMGPSEIIVFDPKKIVVIKDDLP
ncbi:MAG: hypothetical protein WKF63_05300 [Thermomicrobiales bacterium]